MDTLSLTHSVSVLTGFYCIPFQMLVKIFILNCMRNLAMFHGHVLCDRAMSVRLVSLLWMNLDFWETAHLPLP